jgi:hypothetical protein
MRPSYAPRRRDRRASVAAALVAGRVVVRALAAPTLENLNPT